MKAYISFYLIFPSLFLSSMVILGSHVYYSTGTCKLRPLHQRELNSSQICQSAQKRWHRDNDNMGMSSVSADRGSKMKYRYHQSVRHEDFCWYDRLIRCPFNYVRRKPLTTFSYFAQWMCACKHLPEGHHDKSIRDALIHFFQLRFRYHEFGYLPILVLSWY